MLREHFLTNLGRVMDSDELREVAGGITEWARRVRELRNEEGYQILTHNDRAELKAGQYLLEDPTPNPPLARNISRETRAHVLERDGYTCQMCGVAAGEEHPSDPGRKARLHMGHILDKSKGGTDDAANLRVLCSVCNEGAQNVSPIREDLRSVLVYVRRATRADQVEVLRWLSQKFPDQAKQIADSKPASTK